MVHKKVKSDRAGKHYFESASILGGDKSRLFITEDCSSNNTLLIQGGNTKQLHYITRAKTERNLTRKIQLFSSRLLVSLYCAPSKKIWIFLRCGFHGVMLHIKAFASR